MDKVAKLQPERKLINNGIRVQSQELKPIAVLGAGSWGTALALYLARRGQTVRVYSVDTSEITAMLADHANHRYLPGIPLPDNLFPTLQLEDALKDVEDVLIVVPSGAVRKSMESIKPLINKNTRITLASKGIDSVTGKLLSEVVFEVLDPEQPFCVLSGPSFAKEVAQGLPCAVVIASKNEKARDALINRFNGPLFLTHPSDDIIGVETGGAVKNVIAIATGICDGMHLGSNARSAIITFGLEEITRLGLALGAKKDTFTGLAALGDLILTCSDDQSRNRRLGLAIGHGKNIEEAEKEIGQVVEGKRNAELVCKLADKLQIKMPICQLVWNILQGKGNGEELRKIF